MDEEHHCVNIEGLFIIIIFYHKVLDAVAELINKQQRKIDHLLPILESKNEKEYIYVM